jgi:hypothetical protein
MAKKEKHIIETKFLDLKTKFKNNELTINEIDNLTCELILELALLTENGITEINGTSIDLFKDRVWWIVEKAGLLPEYRDLEDDLSDLIDDEEDDYYKVEDDFDFEIDDSKFYKENLDI